MSHDCDCSDCQDTDSRWAPWRRTQKALKEDCPRGVHVAELERASSDGCEYRCMHCKTPTDKKGKDLWMAGEIVVDFQCGVRVVRTGQRSERWGDVHRVFEKAYYYVQGKPDAFEYEWRRDSRIFSREDAIEEASKRVAFAEARAKKTPLDRKVWATATLRKPA